MEGNEKIQDIHLHCHIDLVFPFHFFPIGSSSYFLIRKSTLKNGIYIFNEKRGT